MGPLLKPPKPYFSMFLQGFRARESLKKVPGDHTDPYGSIRVHTDPYRSLSGQFSICLTHFGHFWKSLSNKCQDPKNIFYENQSCSYCDSVQDAPIIKLWGPFFDDFVDISIFMIWGSVDDDDDDDTHPAFPIPPPQCAQEKNTS